MIPLFFGLTTDLESGLWIIGGNVTGSAALIWAVSVHLTPLNYGPRENHGVLRFLFGHGGGHGEPNGRI